MLRLDIRGVNAYPLEKEVLTEGRVGLEISFTFSSEWDGLTKIAVFEGAKTIDVALVSDHCVVPHEALAQSGAALRIGVYGQNTAGDIVIPTVWAKFGQVQPATRLSKETTTPPTPSVVAQILAAAQAAEALAQSVRDDADAGKFDGKSLFWCEYAETTFAEVVQAVEDGLLPVMSISGRLYILGECSSFDARFYCMRSGVYNFLYWAAVDEDDEWNSGNFRLGNYTKPASGIPKSDLSAEVQEALTGSSLFWCEYTETTLAEIVQAVEDGLLPVMSTSGRLYILGECSSTVARFYSVRGGVYNFLYWAAVDEDDEWNSGSFRFGDYTKPVNGIPKTDLAAAVQASLLPAAPAAEGNYVLKCTVAGGNATYSWEPQT